MDRRDFAMSALLGAAAAVLPSASKAAADNPLENVVFTEDDPGHWEDFVSIHVPLTSIDGAKLTVTTPHPQSIEHHIISHSVVLAGGVFLSRKAFTYRNKPVSEHTLPPGYSGQVTVTSTCNWHDFWVKTITV